MKTTYRYIFLLIALLFISFSCSKKDEAKNSENILKGNVEIVVDETIFPIVEDQKIIFETNYKATINIVTKPENQAIAALLSGKQKIALLSRKLTVKEEQQIKSKKITPKTTLFASDGVVLINGNSSDVNAINLVDVVNFLKGKNVTSFKGLVFESANSSTVRCLSDVANIESIPQSDNIFSVNTSEELIKYIAENPNYIGVVGLNWLTQPTPKNQEFVDMVKMLSVKGINKNEFVYPSQDMIASHKYPLARDLYIVNCQGYAGLGMGFGSFITGEKGQRIVLQAGLVPARFPSRKIITRKEIIKEENK